MVSSTAPYGTWSSPITAQAITKGANGVADVIVDAITSEVYHVEKRPSEAGRNVLVHTKSNKDVVGEGWNVRTGVQEYGGSAAVIHAGVIYFSHLTDGRIYRISEGNQPEPVTPDKVPYRYANFEPHPIHTNLLVSVLEDHTDDTPAGIVTSLCIINTKEKSIHPLISSADFYALPKFSSDGTRLAWNQWYHPDMPWEGGQIFVGDVSLNENGILAIINETHVAGVREKISACYPSWANKDTLIFTSDESGYVNPWKYSAGKAAALFPEPVPEDFGRPLWSLNWSPYAVIDAEGTKAVFVAIKDGREVLYFVDLVDGSQPRLLESPFVVVNVIRTVSLEKGEFVFNGHALDDEESIFRGSVSPSKELILDSLLKASKTVTFPTGIISIPRPLTLKVPPNDEPLHVVYYPPQNPEYSGSSVEGELPPCVLNAHGGPTGLSDQALDWKKQYFTSRGWGWLDINYGGSYGYGRAYIQRLASRWGIVDVEDCILASRALSSPPYLLIDPKRVVIRGQSAGGYTVLAALSISSDTRAFAAATSSYGISNFKMLAEFTHKFESKYLDKLIGGSYDEVPEVYEARSPINHADKIVTPLLILQGDIDRVVPKEQSEAIYESIKRRHGVVEFKLYEGEGHGWRQEKNMSDALERELGFYERIFKLKN